MTSQAEFDFRTAPQYLDRRAPRRTPSTAERHLAWGLHAAGILQRQGMAINAQTMHAEVPDLSVAAAEALFESPRFQRELAEQGITQPQTPLSPEQVTAIAIYMDMSAGRTHDQKLRQAGVTATQWKRWMLQPAFAKEITAAGFDALQASIPVAHQRIAEGVDKGDEKFINLALRLTGNDPDQKFDVMRVLMGVFEIIDEEIQDARVMGRIGDRVQAMLGGGAGAQMQRQIVTLPNTAEDAPPAAPQPGVLPIPVPEGD